MASAFPGIPLMDGHVAVRAFAVLPQLLVPQRVAALAAGHQGPAVDEAGALVAETAPGRFTAGVNPGIRAVTFEVPSVAAAVALQVFHSSHLKFRLSHFRAYYSYR
jgi:hypothetical protein